MLLLVVWMYVNHSIPPVHLTLLLTFVFQIPAVDWIIQFDPPDDPRDYIHRVGRTARGANGKGRSLMFLQPSEVGFLKHLKEARVPVVEFEFPNSKIVNVQSQLEKLIGQNYYLNKVNHFLDSQYYKRCLANSPPSPPRKDIVHTFRPTPRTPCDPSLTYTNWIWSRWLRVSDSTPRPASTSRWVLA